MGRYSGQLTEKCLDAWLADGDGFRVDLLRQCQMTAKASGYYFTFDQKAIQVAHTNWGSRCELWEQSYVMSDSDGLSHLKIMAILLNQLASVEWVTDLYEFDPSADGIEFAGTPAEKQEVRKDINAGRGTYLAFQFIVQVINWFEIGRDDRKHPFVFRMSHDFEHDLLVYLLSEKREEMALFLMLKALYVRD